jgi:hypothetical protein
VASSASEKIVAFGAVLAFLAKKQTIAVIGINAPIAVFAVKDEETVNDFVRSLQKRRVIAVLVK